MVKDIKKYPYSSYHYFLEYKNIPECLQDAWVTKNYKEDKEAIEAFLTTPADTQQLQELKTASSLLGAPNSDNKPKVEDLVEIFKDIDETKERNTAIVKAYKQGYSQHMIAKVLELNQATVQRIIKRTK